MKFELLNKNYNIYFNSSLLLTTFENVPRKLHLFKISDGNGNNREIKKQSSADAL